MYTVNVNYKQFLMSVIFGKESKSVCIIFSFLKMIPGINGTTILSLVKKYNYNNSTALHKYPFQTKVNHSMQKIYSQPYHTSLRYSLSSMSFGCQSAFRNHQKQINVETSITFQFIKEMEHVRLRICIWHTTNKAKNK